MPTLHWLTRDTDIHAAARVSYCFREPEVFASCAGLVRDGVRGAAFGRFTSIIPIQKPSIC